MKRFEARIVDLVLDEEASTPPEGTPIPQEWRFVTEIDVPDGDWRFVDFHRLSNQRASAVLAGVYDVDRPAKGEEDAE